MCFGKARVSWIVVVWAPACGKAVQSLWLLLPLLQRYPKALSPKPQTLNPVSTGATVYHLNRTLHLCHSQMKGAILPRGEIDYLCQFRKRAQKPVSYRERKNSLSKKYTQTMIKRSTLLLQGLTTQQKPSSVKLQNICIRPHSTPDTT